MSQDIEQRKSQLHGLIEKFLASFSALKTRSTSTEVENLSIIVYSVMEARWRKYHTIKHIYDVCNTNSPIQILSGLMHDLVYLQVDRRIHPKIKQYLIEFEISRDKYSIIVPHAKPSTPEQSLYFVNSIFGFQGGTELGPFTGANEYLSALVAARALERILKPWDLIQIIACIELTIPFRDKNEFGKTPPEQLEKKILSLCQEMNLLVDFREIKLAVKNSVELANRDVIGFSYVDISQFQLNTWTLILEGNPVFKNPMFTALQLRTALLKVEKFYASIKINTLYHFYDHPEFDNRSVQEMMDRATKNILDCREYYQIRLITMGIFEVISDLTGGEAPIMLLAGQSGQDGIADPILIEHYLNQSIQQCSKSEYNVEVLKLLTDGLFDALSPNTRKLNTSTYLYLRLTRQERGKLYELSKELFDQKITPIDYLLRFDKKLRDSIIHAAAEMVSTRREEILKITALLVE